MNSTCRSRLWWATCCSTKLITASALLHFQQLGRTGGHVAAFERPTLAALQSGHLYVQNWVSTFAEVPGADTYLDELERSYAEAGAVPLSMPPLGERSFAVALRIPGSAGVPTIMAHRLVFRIGTLTSGLDAGAAQGLENADELLRLARIVEGRIKGL